MRVSTILPGVALAFATCVVPAGAWACCPADGHGGAAGSNGLGQSAPATGNLSTDPAWQVYRFRRDGVDYVQVNDSAGNVRAAIGMIGDAAWVLPLGGDAGRTRQIGTPASAAGRVMYADPGVEIRLVQDAGGDGWTFRVLAGASQY